MLPTLGRFPHSHQTDVLPALSLCLEKPETGLLERPPRNIKKERLADLRLLLQAYGFLGILESLCALSMWVTLAVLCNLSF